MANGMTNFLANALLNHVAGTPYAAPTSLCLALYTDPTDATGAGTEVTGGSYARQVIAYSASTAQAIANSAILTYLAMPGVTVTHYGVFDDPTAGNMLFFGPLTTPRTLTDGDNVTFAVGAKTETLVDAA